MPTKPLSLTMAPSEPSGSPTGTLLRGLRMIETLAEAPSPLTVAELSGRVQLDNSTAHRLVQLLVDEGYVVRIDGSKRYCLGPRNLSLLSAYHPISSFVRDTYEIMQGVRDETGETISLIVSFGIERVIVNLVQGRDALPGAYKSWLPNPIHASASGKCLLMTMAPLEIRELLGAGPLRAATEFTTTDVNTLILQIEEAKKRGFAVARDDAFVGLTAVGAPVSRHGKGFASLVIAGASARLTPAAAERYGRALAQATTLISNITPSVTPLANFLGR